jgi:hypothetical protein
MKSLVFSCFLKIFVLVRSRMLEGREFHSLAARTLKLRSPLVPLVRGIERTHRSFEDRSRLRPVGYLKNKSNQNASDWCWSYKWCANTTEWCQAWRHLHFLLPLCNRKAWPVHNLFIKLVCGQACLVVNSATLHNASLLIRRWVIIGLLVRRDFFYTLFRTDHQPDTRATTPQWLLG